MTLDEIINIAKQNNQDQEDYNEIIWSQKLRTQEKIELSLQVFDQVNTTYSLMTLWLEYSVSGTMTSELNKIIFRKYQKELSDSEKDLEGSMEYSLYFDIFDSPELQLEAWNYFISNDPSDKFLKIMLFNAAPLSYSVKDKLYQALLPFDKFHEAIYKSIRNSISYANFYAVEFENKKALETISQLKIAERIAELDKEKGYQPYDQLIASLKKVR